MKLIAYNLGESWHKFTHHFRERAKNSFSVLPVLPLPTYLPVVSNKFPTVLIKDKFGKHVKSAWHKCKAVSDTQSGFRIVQS